MCFKELEVHALGITYTVIGVRKICIIIMICKIGYFRTKLPDVFQ